MFLFGEVFFLDVFCAGVPFVLVAAYPACLETIRLVWYETGVEKEAEAAMVSV